MPVHFTHKLVFYGAYVVSEGVKSVERAFALLEILAGDEKSLGISALARQSQLSLSTAHRLLNTLIQLGYAEQDQETRKYSLGLRILHLRGAVTSRLKLGEQAMPIMKALMRRVDETVHLAVLNEGEVVYVDRVEGMQTRNMYTEIGKRVPAHSTALGKVMLTHLPEATWQHILASRGMPRFTPYTITTPEQMAQELDLIRQRGYAVDNYEGDTNVRCVAAPVRDYSGRVIAAMSISGPRSRMRPERDAELGAAICEAAQQLSANLGYLET